MNITEGMEVCISVKALYDMREDLTFGRIIPDFATMENDCDYALKTIF